MAETSIEPDPQQTTDTANATAGANAAAGGQERGIDPATVRLDLEQRLRDVQLPDAVDWWPPAPGWWVLAVAGLIIGVIVAAYMARQVQYRRHNSPLRQRLDQIFANWIETGKTETYYQQINQQLRLSGRAALGEAFPVRYSDTTRYALAESCYQRDPMPPNADIHAEICAWSDQFALARGTLQHAEFASTNTGVGHV